ncbi:response regulator [Lysobacter sp. CA196]|uniref:response regulator n=1 Tax=Lysobacter sp. CA196 TaxID=3455606 RepID=UPI003F8CF870
MNITAPVKVLIADGHPIIGTTLAQILRTSLGPDKLLVDSIADCDCMLQALDTGEFDYLILDPHTLGRVRDLTLLQAVLQRYPRLETVIYTGMKPSCVALTALELGAKAFILKSSDPLMVIQAIFSVTPGRFFLDPAIDILSAKKHPWFRLTAAEQEVMLALARGEHLHAIAQDSHRSYKTVAAHKYHAWSKLGLRSKAEIGRYMEEYGLGHLLRCNIFQSGY